MRFHTGQWFAIELTPDAHASLSEADAQVPPNRAACKAQLRRLLQQLGDRGKLRSPDQWNKEGEEVYAVKAHCGLRAYGWFHDHRRGVFVVSHVILKKKQKLDPADISRATRNRTELYRSEGYAD